MFQFFLEQDKMPSNLKIDSTTFQENFETVLTLKKTTHTSLNRPQRPCQPENGYIWSDCLDRISRRKECQDPWNYRPNRQEPVCTNISEILEPYGGRWSSQGGWDAEVWDMPYKGRRELADLTREGKQCHVPCTKINYDIEVKKNPRQR